MPKKNKKKSPPPLPARPPGNDPRPAVLFHIAWVSLAMLGICIPLSPILGQFVPWTAPALPALIIICSILCSSAVWTSSERPVPQEFESDHESEIEELKKEVGTLTERLDAIETIYAFDARTDLRTGVITNSRLASPPMKSEWEEGASV